MRRALYPGTFDPITRGHLDILERACRLFDEVWVAVGVNPKKQTLFSLDERLALIERCVGSWPQVRVVAFEGLLVDFARSVGACAVIRGLRQVSDFDYEFQMALTNRRMAPEIETVFLMPSQEYTVLSASLVREIAHWGGDVSPYVPDPVLEALRSRLQKGSEPRAGEQKVQH
ncbi:MAG: pantetheine-phosphate adenylyltransferase [Bacteroidetes bacterium]|nr:pantetheine-phosphate adenylyltransferase [Rhodothermia bacterium]MCS7155002.1 pantetheine-phosphate adenylyltransferase [Bacteroidota bacterium]MCX7907286.1 pantetheine-phosphate adenylyltransferase [Bacteroidota bacterium]MDW8137988.1 pantetheine-phosphate adenylyltransferase [Bacteroidota bacterium]MDW8286160.1 pantetheine-phosphate adenylyltransferase [Bacteroidota bacterium]